MIIAMTYGHTPSGQAWLERHSHPCDDTVAADGDDMTVTETYSVGTHAIFVGEIDVVDGDFLDHIVDDPNVDNGTAGCSLEMSNGKMYIAVPLPTRVIAPVKATDVLGLQAHT